eukprot:CAMPEP_0171111482 /NCGR_PEP_ID=MMETSP0766_2-20121228/75173_1 /TAXON_ID=439317 /ORGANISM="Gambierdiscus australes, Strain CAWD 149" /LENGTH=33 /DNA_ID= /DNA_START= /DNA_END= /DNA_ORIENTATION=
MVGMTSKFLMTFSAAVFDLDSPSCVSDAQPQPL